MEYSVPREVLKAHGNVFPHRFGDVAAYVKKRRQPKNPLGWHAQRLLFRLSGNSLLAPPRRTGLDNVAFESGKLRRLAGLGVLTPQVLHVEADYFVMTAVGETLEKVLRAAPDRRDEMMRMGAMALRRLHDLGEIHGGAQIKNLTLSGDDIYFIDFEEDAAEALLPQFRIRDLYLFASSLERHGHDPDLLALCGWYDPDGDKKALAGLCRSLLGLRVARLLECRLLARLSMRDVRSLNRLIDKAQAALPRGEA